MAVEIEEVLCRTEYPRNGSGMFWSRGSSQLVRCNGRVFATAYEVDKDAPLYSNTRRQFLMRDDGGWRVVQSGPDFEEREPCLLCALPRGRVMMFVNPALKPTRCFGPCTPHLLEFSADEPGRPPRKVMPRWPETPRPVFIDHSYRALSSDGETGEVFALNQDVFTIKYGNWPYCWSYMTPDGAWPRCGRILFPFRSAYAHTAVRAGAAHVMSISDIWEPDERLHAIKLKLNPHCETWDYVFRHLYYTWTPDVMRVPFSRPIEIECAEETAGHISDLDMWLDPEGAAHLLYKKTNIGNAALRDELWPGTPITVTAYHAVIKEGVVVRRDMLFEWTEGDKKPALLAARFHSPDGKRLRILCSMAARDGSECISNALIELDEQYRPVGRLTPLKLNEPLRTFFLANARAGVKPSPAADIQGCGREEGVIRYVRAAL
jgi:hypothetical protein